MPTDDHYKSRNQESSSSAVFFIPGAVIAPVGCAGLLSAHTFQSGFLKVIVYVLGAGFFGLGTFLVWVSLNINRWIDEKYFWTDFEADWGHHFRFATIRKTHMALRKEFPRLTMRRIADTLIRYESSDHATSFTLEDQRIIIVFKSIDKQ